MLDLQAHDERAIALVSAIRSGDTATIESTLRQAPELAGARIVDDRGVGRTLLHVAADWPGHIPNASASVAVLVAAGVDVNAAVRHGNAPETALHWAASSDDVGVLDALLDGGADIEAHGAIFTGGTAMSDAVVFAQWNAARRLLERGAKTTIWQASALGLLPRVEEYLAASPPPSAKDVTNALWHACRGGQRSVAEYLLAHGAELNWIGYDHRTPLDAAHDSGATDLIEWLISRGAYRAEGGRTG